MKPALFINPEHPSGGSLAQRFDVREAGPYRVFGQWGLFAQVVGSASSSSICPSCPADGW